MSYTERTQLSATSQGSISSNGGGNVKVVCRFRPNPEQERIHEIIDNKTVQIKDPNSKEGIRFTFDRTFDVNAPQQEIYTYAAASIIESVIEGFNGTIFAYGQTASGKTHTMEGDISLTEEAGIIPRMVQHLFDSIGKCDANLQFRIKVSIVELYMEKLRDLINNNKTDLKIRSDKTRGVFIEDLSEHYISCPAQVYELIRISKNSRTVASTNMNEESSRSHVLFLLTVRQNNADGSNARNGKLFLVDLAGSEKISRTGAAGVRLDEAKKINTSLTALGKVINALTDGKSTHIPYRDSKLTRVLQESLGGNSKTTLIVTCSTQSINIQETISSLRFGMAVKKIKNKPEINKELTVAELQERLAKAEKRTVERDAYMAQLKNYIVNDLKQKCPQFLSACEPDGEESDMVKELERRLDVERQLHRAEEEQYASLRIKLENVMAEKEELANQLKMAGKPRRIESIPQTEILSVENLIRQIEEVTGDATVIALLRSKLPQCASASVEELSQERFEKKVIQDKYEQYEQTMRKRLNKMEQNLKQLTQTYSELMVVQYRFKVDNNFLRKSNQTKDCCIISLKKKIKELEDHNLFLQNERYEDQNLEPKLKKSYSNSHQQEKMAPKVVKVITGGRQF